MDRLIEKINKDRAQSRNMIIAKALGKIGAGFFAAAGNGLITYTIIDDDGILGETPLDTFLNLSIVAGTCFGLNSIYNGITELRGRNNETLNKALAIKALLK